MRKRMSRKKGIFSTGNIYFNSNFTVSPGPCQYKWIWCRGKGGQLIYNGISEVGLNFNWSCSFLYINIPCYHSIILTSISMILLLTDSSYWLQKILLLSTDILCLSEYYFVLFSYKPILIMVYNLSIELIPGKAGHIPPIWCLWNHFSKVVNSKLFRKRTLKNILFKNLQYF